MSVDLQLAAAQASRGDHRAFRRIVEHTQDSLYRLSCRLLGDPVEAEDILQDAYVKAYRALREGRFEGQSRTETWLYRIVTNTCLDALRRKRLRPVPHEQVPEPDGSAATSPDARLALRELNEWLGELPVEQRATVILRCVEGRTTAETAAILDCSPGAVEQRLLRARAKLRTRELENRENSDE